MQGMCEQLLAGGKLNKMTLVNDGNTVGDKSDRREVVRDEQVGQRTLFFHLIEQVDDLRANRDIQCGNRLVCHEKIGVHDQTARNTDSLTLTARKFVREAGNKFAGQTDLGEDALYLGNAILLVFIQVIVVKSFGNDVIDLGAFIERCHRVLEDHLHLHMKFLFVCSGKFARDLRAVEGNFTADIIGVDAHYRASDSGFTGA